MGRRPLQDEQRVFLRQLGQTIRELRREQGLLQEQLGARSGVPGSRIGEIERGAVDTSISRVGAIAAALGMPASRLLRRRELLNHDDRAADEARAKVVSALRRLRPEEVELLAALVGTLARPR